MDGGISTMDRVVSRAWPKVVTGGWWTVFAGVAVSCVIVVLVLSHPEGRFSPSNSQIALALGSIVGTWVLAHAWLVAAVVVRLQGSLGLAPDWLRFWLLAIPLALLDLTILRLFLFH